MRHSLDLKFIDLFCGIGGFHSAANIISSKENISMQCVFSSDIDEYARKAYSANYGQLPHGDIKEVPTDDIPDHDILFAGFPCQPFSIIGKGKGFEDTRGTLFYEIARILDAKRPKAFILENVKQLVSHDKGATLNHIISTLNHLGYSVDFKVLNALDFGLPQKRERVFIVGYNRPMLFSWPFKSETMVTLASILETNIDKKHFASESIVNKRKESHTSKYYPSIWHENKSGNISSYPYSCALRAGASYNYLLVNGERRLTSREMLRLQGFADDFKIVVPDAQVRKQAGNAVPVNLVTNVLESLIKVIRNDNLINNNLQNKETLHHELRMHAR
jgi:DNA (cytosine-5)-methyltransferase 1